MGKNKSNYQPDKEYLQLINDLYTMAVPSGYKGETATLSLIDEQNKKIAIKIPHETALQIASLNADGSQLRDQEFQALNLVQRVNNTFYKTYQFEGIERINPNYEYASRALSKAIFNNTSGHGVTDLITVSDLHFNNDTTLTPHHIPVQASLAVTGPMLTQIVQRNSLNNLDAAHFSQQVLLEMLKKHADGKGDNFIVREKNNGQQEIITIDGDKMLGNDIAKTYGGEHYVELKSTLFMVKEHMNNPVDATVAEQFLSKSPKEIMTTWLKDLKQQATHNAKFEKNNLLSNEQMQELNMDIQLPAETIENMYHDIDAAQDYMRNHPGASHQQVFSAVHPMAALYYENLNNQSSTLEEAYNTLFEERKFNIEDIVPHTQLQQNIEYRGRQQNYQSILDSKTAAVNAVEEPDHPKITIKGAIKELDEIAARSQKIQKAIKNITTHVTQKKNSNLLGCANKSHERSSWLKVTATLLTSHDKQHITKTINEEVDTLGKGDYSKKLKDLCKTLEQARVPEDIVKNDAHIKTSFATSGGNLEQLSQTIQEANTHINTWNTTVW